MARYTILLFLFLVCWHFGCPSGPDISEAELKKRKDIQQALKQSEEAFENGDFQKAVDILNKISKQYPQSPKPYQKLANISLEQIHKLEKKNILDSAPYLSAIQGGVEYFKRLNPKKENEKEIKKAKKSLIWLTNILKTVFSGIPIQKFDEALRNAEDLVPLVENQKWKEAKLFLGYFYLYKFRLDKAKEYLQQAAMIEANDGLKMIVKLKQVEPESSAGKKLVFRKVLRRGDAAAFFAFEMKKYKLKEENRIPGRYTEGMTIQDIQDYWAKNEIEYCLKMGVMRLLGSKTFQPSIPLQRIEAAILAINVLRIHKGDFRLIERYKAKTKLETFEDKEEDFGTDEFDESNEPYAFGAVQEGFFQIGKDKKFYPTMSLSGLEFMEILHKLKKKIRSNG